MDLRHMRQFVAVAEEAHFGRAAKRLNMAQPPLSQSIRRLEADLGIDLFDRSRRSVELTSAGRVFLEEARRTLVQADLARKMAVREAQSVPEVRVSFVGPALYRILPDAIVRYRAARPDVHIRLFERASSDQIAGLLAGDFDIGFVTTGVSHPEGCDTLVVERTSFVAALPADWPLAQSSSVSLSELAEHPFIRPPERFTMSSSGPDTYALFKAAGVMPRVAQEATQTNTCLSLVGAGLGFTLVMTSAKLTGARNVRFLPIREAPESGAPWELVMAWSPHALGASAKDFIAFMKSYIADNPALVDPTAPID